MAQIDLLLLHAPSVYDFREKAILYGPISDLIPSSPVFEMYPLGFLTMTNYLEARGLKVRIVNLALRMMNDLTFDVPAFLATLHPQAVGIDLHWLPHAHGSLEIAQLVREIHPHVPIIFGGLSATYFHEELIRYPQVDYVLRGDSVEPPLYTLLQKLQTKDSLADVPNLTWKEQDPAGQTTVKINPHSFVPQTLDYIDLRPDRLIKMVWRYRDLISVLPFNGWWQNPITAVFTVKGCAHECVTCGSSSYTCTHIHRRQTPVFRSPQNLVQNMHDISHFSKGPIFLVGDLRQAGDQHLQETLDHLRTAPIDNEIVFEFFGMPPAGTLTAIDQAVPNWSIELSPESHDETIRQAQDKHTFYTNAQMEAVIAEALSLRCHRIDIFFMVGLPQQTATSVRQTIDYCEHLFQTSDKRLSCFISPLGPFLDPGSRGFEQPEQLGYRLFAHTLEEHRQLLIQPSWAQMLNYETVWMTREQLTTATYDAGEALNALKLKYNRIDPAQGQAVAQRITQARALLTQLNTQQNGHPDLEANKLLMGKVHDFSVSTVCDKTELFWKRHLFNFKMGGILRKLFAH